VCKAAVRPKADNEAYPFCSSRCRLVDLGKWIDGEYRIPAKPADGEPDPSTDL